MKYKFFIGLPLLHQKIHFKFIQSILGGDCVTCNCVTRETEFPKKVLQHDGKDVIWFFNDIYYNLHPKLKGKQILTMHGLSFKRWIHKQRANTINNYIDLVFQTGTTHDREFVGNGVAKEKIKKIGLTTLFEIPKLPLQPNSILFSFAAFNPWNNLYSLINILRDLDTKIKGYLTIHPQVNAKTKKVLIGICEEKGNLTFLSTQEKLLNAYAYCQYYAGGLSSVATPFWYLQKPVIFIFDHNESQLNKFKLAKCTNHPSLFYKVINETSIFCSGMKLNLEFIKKALISHSAKKIFYPSNFDRILTTSLIKEAIEKIKKNDY